MARYSQLYRIFQYGRLIAEAKFPNDQTAQRWFDNTITGRWLDGCKLEKIDSSDADKAKWMLTGQIFNRGN